MWWMWLIGVLVFIVMLLISIGIHEAGHLFVARFFKLDTPRYFVGFGPTVWSRTKNGCEYGLKAVPAGGFVEIYDPGIIDESNPERGLLSKIHPAKRIAVFAAGPAVNLVAGAILILSALLIMPYAVPTTEIRTVEPCSTDGVCGAYEAGLEPGDTVIAVDGNKTKDISKNLTSVEDGSTVILSVDRLGELLEVPVEVNDHRLGVNVALEKGRRTVQQAWDDGIGLTKESLVAIVELPGKLPGVVRAVFGNEERAEDSPGSIVAAADVYGTVMASDDFTGYEKFTQLLFFAGAINLSLGFINLLLPMLPLDGGRIAIAVVDWGRMGYAKVFRKEYKPTGPKVLEALTYSMGILIFGMMGLLILADFVAPLSI